MSASNIKHRLNKLETAATPPSQVHTIISDCGDDEIAIDRYGRNLISACDLVVVIRRFGAPVDQCGAA
jgi:hypothetical protein